MRDKKEKCLRFHLEYKMRFKDIFIYTPTDKMTLQNPHCCIYFILLGVVCVFPLSLFHYPSSNLTRARRVLPSLSHKPRSRFQNRFRLIDELHTHLYHFSFLFPFLPWRTPRRIEDCAEGSEKENSISLIGKIKSNTYLCFKKFEAAFYNLRIRTWQLRVERAWRERERVKKNKIEFSIFAFFLLSNPMMMGIKLSFRLHPRMTFLHKLQFFMCVRELEN